MARTVSLCLLGLSLSGCASHATKTALDLDINHPKFSTPQCKAALEQTGFYDGVKNARMVAGPTLVVLSGGLLAIPVLAVQAGLDTLDHREATTIARTCGGKEKSDEQIATEVGTSAALGLAVGQLAGAASAGVSSVGSGGNR